MGQTHVRQTLWIAACALAVSVGSGAGQTPTAAEPANDAFARMLATPRYYRIAASGGMKNQDGYKICFGGDGLRKLFDGLRDMAEDRQAVAKLSKECTQKTVRSGESIAITQDCEKANGAIITSHMRLFGTLDEFHQTLEVALPGFGPNGADNNVISDVVMTYLGQCPANVGPGQMLSPDGVISGPLVDMTGTPA